MRSQALLATLKFAMLCLTIAPPIPLDDDVDDGSFGLTAPIACKEIRGYADYESILDPALTADEKLLVYYCPRHFKTERAGDKYQAHFTQDGRIRRRGEKAVLWSKTKLLDYKATSDQPPQQIFLRNTISLKGLKPGDYDFEIILHDEVGRSVPAARILRFKVVAALKPPDDPVEERKKPGAP